ncbi:hypothetical protein LCGC14_2502620, partial [marine sediment metagenome]
HLECKSPLSPTLNRDMKDKLARALSGFSNTAGGVVLWGVATTPHSHSKLDVISHLEPVGNCARFEKQIRAAIPTLTSPSVLKYETKLIKRRRADTQGVIAVYIPFTSGDPLLNNNNNVFYFRSSDEFVPAPYELIKRLFSATDVPDVYPMFTQELVNLETDGSWSIPIIIDNRSTAYAEDMDVSVTIINPSSCENITASKFRDTSDINPGMKVFMASLERGIHRGMPVVVGTLKVKMKTSKRIKRRLDISISTYANRMRARNVKYTLTLAKSKFTVKTISDDYMY